MILNVLEIDTRIEDFLMTASHERIRFLGSE